MMMLIANSSLLRWDVLLLTQGTKVCVLHRYPVLFPGEIFIFQLLYLHWFCLYELETLVMYRAPG